MELSLPFVARPRRTRSAAGKGARGSRAASASSRARALAWLTGNRLALRVLVCTLLALPLLGGGWLWLRDSSLVSVRHVHISGVHGAEAVEIRAALDHAAVRMSTMDFDAAKLRAAVASFTLVGALRVTTSFPHTVHISVTERPPVAAFFAHGQSTAVAADGTVLGPALSSSALPQVAGSYMPAAGSHLREAAVLADVAVIGAAPKPIARYIARVSEGHEGLTVAMRNGLLVYFGDASRPHAKWLSLARVLVSPSSAGALYVDVRLPERPAAGMSSEASALASGSSASSAALSASSSEPTTAALAARLSDDVGGGSSASSAASTTSGSGSEESEASSSESEASSSESATSSSEGEASAEH